MATPMRLTITIDYDGDDESVMIDWLMRKEKELGDMLTKFYPNDLKYESKYETMMVLEKDERLLRNLLERHDKLLVDWMETPISNMNKYNKLLSELDIAKGEIVYALRKVLG